MELVHRARQRAKRFPTTASEPSQPVQDRLLGVTSPKVMYCLLRYAEDI